MEENALGSGSATATEVQPPWQHAIIISTPDRFTRAAAEARRAGFIARYMPARFSNRSRCHPDPDLDDPEIRKRVALENAIDAYRDALSRIAESGRPHAVFEDDIVLATSRAEVHRWLHAPMVRSVRVRSGGATTHEPWELVNLSFPRLQFDLVPLGSCGSGLFSCTHAIWYTPRGARTFLSMRRQRCQSVRLDERDVRVSRLYRPAHTTKGDDALPGADAMPGALERALVQQSASKLYALVTPVVDLNVFTDVGWNLYSSRVVYPPHHRWRPRVCSTLCAPNRTLTPHCWDEEAWLIVTNRECTDEELRRREYCTLEALRCVDWHDLDEYRGPGFPMHQHQQSTNSMLKPPRYWGYGHFVQDRMNRHAAKRALDEECGLGRCDASLRLTDGRKLRGRKPRVHA